jgi:hypothetical protein
VTTVSRLSEKIKQADDLATEHIHVPEWDVDLLLRSMSSRQRSAFAAISEGRDEGMVASMVSSVMIHAMVSCCLDPETMDPVFDSGDADWVTDKNASVIERLGTACLRVSGLTKEAEGDAGKDSSGSLIHEDEPDLSGGSSSD